MNPQEYLRISAPPMAAVVSQPLAKLSAVLPNKQAAPIIGAVGAIVMKAPMVNAFAPNRELLMICLPGSVSGREDTRPASLRKATIEPVNVTPPNRYKHRMRKKERE